jgi:mycothiol synthase
MTITLPKGFLFRATTTDDAQGIVDLMNIWDEIEMGKSELTVQFILDDWKHLKIEEVGRIVVDSEGRVVGSEELFHKTLEAPYMLDGYVHPDCLNLGIGSFLLQEGLQRVAEQAERDGKQQYSVQANIFGGNESAQKLLLDHGFQVIRYFYRMEQHFVEPPIVAELPEGIEIRPFERGHHEQALYEAVEEAFQDHWNHFAKPFDEWLDTLYGDGYEDGLSLVAWDGDQIVGSALCYYRGDGGWIRNLSVRRAWRRRGVAQALLQSAFAGFYQRGRSWVGLGVDASSPTGATRVYERAGMKVTARYETYEIQQTIAESAS